MRPGHGGMFSGWRRMSSVLFSSAAPAVHDVSSQLHSTFFNALCLSTIILLDTFITAVWQFGLVVGHNQQSYSTSVSAWMGNRLRMVKPSWYVTSHPGQLSLAIPPCVGAMSTSESWGVNGHTARYTSPVSVVSQCKLVSG